MRNTYIYKIVSILVITGLTFFSFTNADSISFKSINGDYSPKTLVLTKEFNFNSNTVINNSCNKSRCELAIIGGGKRCYITNSNGNLYFEGCSNLPARSYTLSNCAGNGFDWCYNSISLKLPDPPLVQGGTDAFNGAINKLGTYAGEIIPYMLYIALGTLGVSILFVALKRLINRIKRKTFKSIR